MENLLSERPTYRYHAATESLEVRLRRYFAQGEESHVSDKWLDICAHIVRHMNEGLMEPTDVVQTPRGQFIPARNIIRMFKLELFIQLQRI